MKKYLQIVKSHLLCIYIILNILFILITSFLYAFKISTYHFNSLLYIPCLILNIFVILFYVFFKIKTKKKLRFRNFDIFLFIMFIFSLISSILSINTHDAFFGFLNRYEGFFQIMYYFSLFILSSFLPNEDKKKVSYAFIILGLIQVVHAHIQKFELLNVPILYDKTEPWATGYVSNPNFFGSLMVLCLTIAIGLLFDSNSKRERIIYSFVIAFFTSGLLISDSLSALVGLIISLIYVLIYSLIKHKKILFLTTTIIITLVTIIISCLNQTTLVNDLIKTKDQSVEIVKGNVKDNYGTNRIFVWKNAIKVVPKNLTYGVGIDNFYYAFGDKPLMFNQRYFDKAHNEYLQILVCEGIYALLSYLVFVGIIVINGIRYSFNKTKLYLVLPIVAYLTQAFFNISVIEVAPLFYIYLGLCSNRNKECLK